MHGKWIAILLVVGWHVLPAAAALPPAFVSAGASASAEVDSLEGTFNDLYDTGPFVPAPSGPATAAGGAGTFSNYTQVLKFRTLGDQPVIFRDRVSAAVSVTADYGRLRGSASAFAEVTPLVATAIGTSNGVEVEDQIVSTDAAEARGDGFAEWRDVLTIRSDTLPPDTPVRVRGTLTLDGGARSTAAGDVPLASAIAELTVGFGPGARLVLAAPAGLSPTSGPQTATFETTAYVGLPLNVRGILSLTAAADVGFPVGTMDSVVEAGHTAVGNIDVLTPGAYYTSASGATYVTPEPAAAGSVAGLALLLASGRGLRPSRSRVR